MSLIEILKAVFLGIVEGITEWLPVSSTGHMILVENFIKLNSSDAYKEMFFVVIQLGAILAVVLLFFNKLNPFSPRKNRREKMETMQIWFKVVIGVIPAGVMGLLFDDWLNEKFYNFQTVAVTLIVYGILFILVENKNKDRRPRYDDFKNLTYSAAFMIGIFQVLSLIPGTSRSGATILGGIIIGASRYIAAEFSFFMSIPIMFGASALKLYKFGFDFTMDEFVILAVGMVTAFLVSLLAISLLLRYIKNNDFKVFGWYRIGLGIVVLAYFILA